MRQFLIFLLVGVFGTNALAQPSDRGIWVGFMDNHGRMYGGPDPHSPSNLLALVEKSFFDNYLKISPEQRKDLGSLRASLPTPTVAAFRSSPDPELALKLFEAEVDEEIRNRLTTKQYNQLQQLCYRIEIGILGFPNSISYGRLADAVGVYDNQREHLHKQADLIARSIAVRRQAIGRDAEIQILQLLPESHRLAASKLLGDFFEFNYIPQTTEYGSISLDHLRVLETYKLYRSPQVRLELRLSNEQVEAIDGLLIKSAKSVGEIFKKANGNKLSDDQEKIVSEARRAFLVAFDEVFNPSQVRRLDQLIFRNQIRELGYRKLVERFEALEGLKLSDTMREDFLRECASIDKSTREARASVMSRMEVEIEKELTVEQRGALKNAIGDFFEYSPTAMKPSSSAAVYPN